MLGQILFTALLPVTGVMCCSLWFYSAAQAQAFQERQREHQEQIYWRLAREKSLGL